MPPRMSSSRGAQMPPTRSYASGSSSLPDDAFDVEAYTRELNPDRRDMDSYYNEMFAMAPSKADAKWMKKRRSMEAGPIHCPHKY